MQEPEYAVAEYWPAKHGVHCALPAVANWPAWQGLQPVWPVAPWDCPAGHVLHDVDADPATYCPTGQSVHDDEPLYWEYFPALQLKHV